MLAGRRRPLRAPRSAAMGEMQGALARARLESLLRPRHKKRAEAQKRSESVLLSGLGKCRRPVRRDTGCVEVGRDGVRRRNLEAARQAGDGHRGGERSAVTVHCRVHSGRTGEEMENHRGSPPLHCPPPAQADRGRVQPGAGSCSRSPRKLRSCPGWLAWGWLTRDTAASRPSFPNSVYSLLSGWGGRGWSLVVGGASRWAALSRFLLLPSPPPRGAELIKPVARLERTVG